MTKQTKKPYNAKNIANYLIFLASQENQEKEREGVTNLKLQKILYFAQAYYLAKLNKPLFIDKIEAWEYGPVIHKIYTEFKSYKNKPIIVEKDISEIEESDKEFIKKIWNSFGVYSASRLVEVVHSHTPWLEAKNSSSKIISQKTIKDYYSPLLNK